MDANMIIKTLGISTSPRIKGNSDLLLREALAGAESAGANTEYIRLSDYNIAPCIECNTCYTTGTCKIQDDFQQLLKKMLDADRLVFATPIFLWPSVPRQRCLSTAANVFGRISMC